MSAFWNRWISIYNTQVAIVIPKKSENNKKQQLKEIKDIYDSVKPEIRNRLKDFDSVWKIGDDKIRSTIDHLIRLHDKLLLILSERSINSSWVEKEVETAFKEEDRRGETVLFPVQLDETVMETDQAWAANIRRTRHIGDFSQWQDHEAYQQSFARLLRDLAVKEE